MCKKKIIRNKNYLYFDENCYMNWFNPNLVPYSDPTQYHNPIQLTRVYERNDQT